MINEIILGALIGAVATLGTQAITHRIRKDRIKNVVRVFLNETLKDPIDSMELEMKEVLNYASSFDAEDLTIGMHPSFNARILHSFSLEDLYSVYGVDVKYIIDTIGIIENLEGRLPYKYFQEYLNFHNEHISVNFEKHIKDFPTEKVHHTECPSMNRERQRLKSNFNNVSGILVKLNQNIDTINSIS
ncbi:MAG: hypothetical protein ACJAUR_000108 [Ulvibacter sp.]|jgi:hypothetical protein